MYKRFFVSFIVLTMIMLLVSCSGSSTDDKKEVAEAKQENKLDNGDVAKSESQVILKLAEVHPDDYPTTKGDLEFARLVEEKTDGRIKIEVYANGKIDSSEINVAKMIELGSVDFARISSGALSEYSNKLNAMGMPYLYRDAEHMRKVLNSEIGDELLNSLDSSIVGLCWYESGARNFYNSIREIKSIDDISGLKFRVIDNPMYSAMVKNLGGIPDSTIGYKDVLLSLQNGVIDGAENNFPSYYTAEHYKATRYMTEDEHLRIPEMTIASKSSMDKLSAEDQEIIKDSAKESAALQIKEWAKFENESREKVVAEGVVITLLDEDTKAEFESRMQPIYDSQEEEIQDIIKRIKEIK